MKTFETEKSKIPEGATHYANESDVDYFLWCKIDREGKVWGLVEDEGLISTVQQIKKPRTKTEFVKLNYGLEHFAAGSELFSGRDLYVLSRDGNYYKIKRQDKAVKASQDGRIYERVENEIDERQEFIDEALKLYAANANEMFGIMYDSGKFKLVE